MGKERRIRKSMPEPPPVAGTYPESENAPNGTTGDSNEPESGEPLRSDPECGLGYREFVDPGCAGFLLHRGHIYLGKRVTVWGTVYKFHALHGVQQDIDEYYGDAEVAMRPSDLADLVTALLVG